MIRSKKAGRISTAILKPVFSQMLIALCGVSLFLTTPAVMAKSSPHAAKHHHKPVHHTTKKHSSHHHHTHHTVQHAATHAAATKKPHAPASGFALTYEGHTLVADVDSKTGKHKSLQSAQPIEAANTVTIAAPESDEPKSGESTLFQTIADAVNLSPTKVDEDDQRVALPTPKVNPIEVPVHLAAPEEGGLEAPAPVSSRASVAAPEPRQEPVAAAPHTSFAASVQQHLVNFVHRTVATLRYSDYKLGGRKFDSSRGVYIVDCSSFVDHILRRTSPHAYTSLVSATGADTPATQHYYDFFTELSNGPDNFWNKVDAVQELRAGDILVFRYKNHRGYQTGGHVMVVMDKPIRDSDVFFVRVADSAPSRHSQDTRQWNEAGIGIGTLVLKVNPRTGKPAAFAWGLGGLWNKNVNFAMARPLDTGDLG